MSEDQAPAWHQALLFALTGERRPELGHQREPDVSVVLEAVGRRTIRARAVPADLLVGIGPAQLAAVLTELRARLSATDPRAVLADRPLDAEERRLMAERPPHH